MNVMIVMLMSSPILLATVSAIEKKDLLIPDFSGKRVLDVSLEGTIQ